jgi:hypothetical protein
MVVSSGRAVSGRRDGSGWHEGRQFAVGGIDRRVRLSRFTSNDKNALKDILRKYFDGG